MNRSVADNIPNDHLNAMTKDAGFLPSMGVHRSGDIVSISPSRSPWILLAGSVIASAGVSLLPPIAWVLIPPLIIGSIVGIFAAPMMARRFGVEVTIDPGTQHLTLVRHSFTREIPFKKILAFQILPRSKRQFGQLNLVYLDDEDNVTRICLVSHSIQFYLNRMARKLSLETRWPVLDQYGDAGQC